MYLFGFKTIEYLKFIVSQLTKASYHRETADHIDYTRNQTSIFRAKLKFSDIKNNLNLVFEII